MVFLVKTFYMKVFFVLSLIIISVICSSFFKDDLTVYANKVISDDYAVHLYTTTIPQTDCNILSVSPYFIIKTTKNNVSEVKRQIKKQGIKIAGETIILKNFSALQALSKFKVAGYKKTELTTNTTLLSGYSTLFALASENIQIATSEDLTLIGVPKLLGSY